MAIQLSISTASIGANWRSILPKLKELGFEGVEVTLDGGISTAEIKKAVDEAGLKVAVLATRLELDGRYAGEIKQALANAQALDASAIRVFGGLRLAGETVGGAVVRIAAGLGAEASQSDIRILIQNGYDFTEARDLWALCQAAGQHLGVCWDFGVGAATQESPVTAVSTLNSRIGHVHVWDAKKGNTADNTPGSGWNLLTSTGFQTPVALGTGDVPNGVGLERLRGIGYSGWVSYAPPHRQQDEAAWEEELKKAGEQIKLWLGLIKPTPPAEPAKPAAPAAAATKPATPAAKPATTSA